jgi:hypothetical protein
LRGEVPSHFAAENGFHVKNPSHTVAARSNAGDGEMVGSLRPTTENPMYAPSARILIASTVALLVLTATAMAAPPAEKFVQRILVPISAAPITKLCGA